MPSQVAFSPPLVYRRVAAVRCSEREGELGEHVINWLCLLFFVSRRESIYDSNCFDQTFEPAAGETIFPLNSSHRHSLIFVGIIKTSSAAYDEYGGDSFRQYSR